MTTSIGTAPPREAMRVPYGLSVHGEDEIAAVVRVLRTSTQMGESVRQMERRVADLFAKAHGIMVNSGSSALQLAVELLGLPEGSEVITPALTFSTTVAPLVRSGLIPSFVDVEPDTFNIDVEQIEAAITPNTRALAIPSLIGNLPDWDRIAQIAHTHDLRVIEDSADTLGATLRGTSTGTRTGTGTSAGSTAPAGTTTAADDTCTPCSPCCRRPPILCRAGLQHPSRNPPDRRLVVESGWPPR